MRLLKVIKKNWPEIILFVCFFLFSWWLMWHTFDYKNGTVYIATKAWSDFAANIPLIRSFSWGKNWPPEYPLFPGEPIKYHFLFYFLVGMLEKAGLPLDWALNLPSALGFFGLLLMIYLLTKLIFEKKIVALLAVIFFLFNSSLSFLEFFHQHPLSLNTPFEIINNKTFSSFGPYDGKIVSAFWNLNIFTNQRHLAASFFLVFLAIYILVKAAKSKKKLSLRQIIFLGFIVGLLPFFHKVGFIIAAISLISFFLYLPKLRRQIFIAGTLALTLAVPQLAYQFSSGMPSFMIKPGYLIIYPLTFCKIIIYWFLNLGLSLILIPLGFFLANKLAKKLFLTVLPLFFVGNLFQFSPEVAANHKFFNFLLIIGNIFTAWVVYLIWQKRVIGKLIAPILIFLMVFSGIIDFFPIQNDSLNALADAPQNPDIFWIKKNTPPEAVFLNSSFLYHPASLAGRKIFLGWPYFSWSAGYDTYKRGLLRNKIYNANNLNEVCKFLRANQINYLDTIPLPAFDELKINYSFFEKNFLPLYKNPISNFKIYDATKSCH